MDNNKSQQQNDIDTSNNKNDNDSASTKVTVPTSMEILYKELFEEPENLDKNKKNGSKENSQDNTVKNDKGDVADGVPSDQIQSGQTVSSDSSQQKQKDSPLPSDSISDKQTPGSSQQDTSQQQSPDMEKYKEFISELKNDPAKAWRKFEKDLELPPLEVVQQIIKTSDSLDESSIKTQLKIYQKNLKNEIEKEFNLDPGTFRYDADEAVDVDTPSYAFYERSRRYEEQLRNDLQSKLRFAKEQAEMMRKVQEEDKKWFKETFYKDSPEKADEAIKNLSLIPAKILSGELPPHKHPFSLRTMLLGVYFDELTERIKQETEENVKRAYEERGMFLNKKAPEDLKKNARAGSTEKDFFANATNPMEKHIGSILK